MIYQKGEKVEALDVNGIWYSAEVLESTEQETLVKYIGWSEKWNRLVSKTQIRASTAGLPRKRRTFFSRQVCICSQLRYVSQRYSHLHISH